MKFYNHHHKRKFKRYRKAHTNECAIVFKDSNDLIDFICNFKTKDIKSSLYTFCGHYQLVISYSTVSNVKSAVFKDKPHLDELKTKGQLICNDNVILKMQRAFKEP